MLQQARKKKTFKPAHQLPGKFWMDYILLPYGAYYDKTAGFLKAEPGDIVRFFNGPDKRIEKVMLIKCDDLCNFLSKMRYGISFDKALVRYRMYARMEGYAKDAISDKQCIIVFFENDENSK